MIYERADRGKVFGDEVVVRDCNLDRHSFLADLADVWASTFELSSVVGDSRVRSSLVEQSTIGCRRLPTEVVQSHVISSRILGGSVVGGYVLGSVIKGQPVIRGSISEGGCKILNSVVRDYATVTGTAIVMGITLRDRMMVDEGVWDRAPRYAEIVEPEICDLPITEAPDGKAKIGCRTARMTDWLRGRERYRKAVRWPQDVADRVAMIFERWLDEPV